MPRYIQLDENNFVVATLTADSPPVHPNQYEVSDAAELIGKVLEGGTFYPPKIVADTDEDGIEVELGEKVSG